MIFNFRIHFAVVPSFSFDSAGERSDRHIWFTCNVYRIDVIPPAGKTRSLASRRPVIFHRPDFRFRARLLGSTRYLLVRRSHLFCWSNLNNSCTLITIKNLIFEIHNIRIKKIHDRS